MRASSSRTRCSFWGEVHSRVENVSSGYCAVVWMTGTDPMGTGSRVSVREGPTIDVAELPRGRDALVAEQFSERDQRDLVRGRICRAASVEDRHRAPCPVVEPAGDGQLSTPEHVHADVEYERTVFDGLADASREPGARRRRSGTRTSPAPIHCRRPRSPSRSPGSRTRRTRQTAFSETQGSPSRCRRSRRRRAPRRRRETRPRSADRQERHRLRRP